ncbi:MAG: hypothetical protein ACR2GZ_10915 [Solirubrobacteraceae bacterium]
MGPPNSATEGDEPAFDEKQVSVIFIGSFNPRILQPSWFDARGLLTERDVEAAGLLVSDAVTAFRTPLFTLLCDQNRCQITTASKTPTPDLIRDLAVDMFEILGETPINGIGINAYAHVPPRVKTWDAVVAQLGDPHKTLELMEGQGLRTVELTGLRPGDGLSGSRQVLMQPSNFITDGVFILVNDDVRLGSPEDQGNGRMAVEILRTEWKPSRDFAETTIEHIAPTR